MDQVRQYGPPPNPAKITDSRSGDYITRFGTESWELDALDPQVLDDLIREHVEDLTNPDLRWVQKVRQREFKRTFEAAFSRWEKVAEFLRSDNDE
jgi:hypothetical protein